MGDKKAVLLLARKNADIQLVCRGWLPAHRQPSTKCVRVGNTLLTSACCTFLSHNASRLSRHLGAVASAHIAHLRQVCASFETEFDPALHHRGGRRENFTKTLFTKTNVISDCHWEAKEGKRISMCRGGSSAVHLRHATVLSKAHRHTEAAKVLRRALALDPDNVFLKAASRQEASLLPSLATSP